MLTYRDLKLTDQLPWDDLVEKSKTATFFQTKKWLELLAKYSGGKVRILGMFSQENLVGIVPLHLLGGKLNFFGSHRILNGKMLSDFGDIIALPGFEEEVWRALKKEIEAWRKKEKRLEVELNNIREDSLSLPICQKLGWRAEEVDVSPYLDLPETWEEYLRNLTKHQRHELRRKMRRLEKEGEIKVIRGDLVKIDEFLTLMKLSDKKKASFLTFKMRQFFKEMLTVLVAEGEASLYFLELAGHGIAGVILFQFKEQTLLYNSGFDPKAAALSPGIILVARMVQQAIREKKKRFDFLRGEERYKYDLGAKSRRLFKITL